MAKIIDGKEIAKNTREQIAAEVSSFIERTGVTPGLAVIIVGDDPASQVYVRNKKKVCVEAGMNSWVIEMPKETTQDGLMAEIERLKASADALKAVIAQINLD